MKVHSVYDAGESTPDRYTVFYKGRGARERDGTRMCRGMSKNPFHPMGFGQMCSGHPGPHCGIKITVADLPPDCQRLVLQDMK